MSDKMPDTMPVVEIAEDGGPEVLKPAERSVPAPRPGEVLVKVAAAGVNGPDRSICSGLYVNARCVFSPGMGTTRRSRYQA